MWGFKTPLHLLSFVHGRARESLRCGCLVLTRTTPWKVTPILRGSSETAQGIAKVCGRAVAICFLCVPRLKAQPVPCQCICMGRICFRPTYLPPAISTAPHTDQSIHPSFYLLLLCPSPCIFSANWSVVFITAIIFMLLCTVVYVCDYLYL